MENERGFLQSLFDMSFSNLITMRIIKTLYKLVIVFAVIAVLVMIFGGFSRSAGIGLLSCVLGVIMFFLWVVLARISLEVTMILFKIEENTRKSPPDV